MTTPCEGETMTVQNPLQRAIHVSLPKRLREVREERELSLEEMAEQIGLEVSELRRYENGHAHPTPNAVEAIAAALGVDVLSLLGYPS